MKYSRHTLMCIALLSGWLISPSLYAKNLKNSAGVGIAGGGTAKAPSLSMEYDFFTTNRRYNYMVGGLPIFLSGSNTLFKPGMITALESIWELVISGNEPLYW